MSSDGNDLLLYGSNDEMCHEIFVRVQEQASMAQRLGSRSDPLLVRSLLPPEMAQSTFHLPAVEKIQRYFLPLDKAVNVMLAPLVNWAPPSYKPTDQLAKGLHLRLWAVATRADGNCLMHAVSFCLWGQQDMTSTVRSLVQKIFSDAPSVWQLFRDWREEQRREDQRREDAGVLLEMEEGQVMAEWHKLVEAAQKPSAYLSSVHIYVLANVLRRPIIVYGDRYIRGRDGRAYAPSEMPGIYLPTLLPAKICSKTPIAVGYTCKVVGKVGHFSALVGIDGELGHLPLCDEHGVDLPVRYGSSSMVEEYVTTTPCRTKEELSYRMAKLPQSEMIPGAQGVQRSLELAARRDFEQYLLSREQKKKLIGTGRPLGSPTPKAPLPIGGDSASGPCSSSSKTSGPDVSPSTKSSTGRAGDDESRPPGDKPDVAGKGMPLGSPTPKAPLPIGGDSVSGPCSSSSKTSGPDVSPSTKSSIGRAGDDGSRPPGDKPDVAGKGMPLGSPTPKAPLPIGGDSASEPCSSSSKTSGPDVSPSTKSSIGRAGDDGSRPPGDKPDVAGKGMPLGSPTPKAPLPIEGDSASGPCSSSSKTSGPDVSPSTKSSIGRAGDDGSRPPGDKPDVAGKGMPLGSPTPKAPLPIGGDSASGPCSSSSKTSGPDVSPSTKSSIGRAGDDESRPPGDKPDVAGKGMPLGSPTPKAPLPIGGDSASGPCSSSSKTSGPDVSPSTKSSIGRAGDDGSRPPGDKPDVPGKGMPLGSPTPKAPLPIGGDSASGPCSSSSKTSGPDVSPSTKSSIGRAGDDESRPPGDKPDVAGKGMPLGSPTPKAPLPIGGDSASGPCSSSSKTSGPDVSPSTKSSTGRAGDDGSRPPGDKPDVAGKGIMGFLGSLFRLIKTKTTQTYAEAVKRGSAGGFCSSGRDKETATCTARTGGVVWEQYPRSYAPLGSIDEVIQAGQNKFHPSFL